MCESGARRTHTRGFARESQNSARTAAPKTLAAKTPFGDNKSGDFSRKSPGQKKTHNAHFFFQTPVRNSRFRPGAPAHTHTKVTVHQKGPHTRCGMRQWGVRSCVALTHQHTHHHDPNPTNVRWRTSSHSGVCNHRFDAQTRRVPHTKHSDPPLLATRTVACQSKHQLNHKRTNSQPSPGHTACARMRRTVSAASGANPPAAHDAARSHT